MECHPVFYDIFGESETPKTAKVFKDRVQGSKLVKVSNPDTPDHPDGIRVASSSLHSLSLFPNIISF